MSKINGKNVSLFIVTQASPEEREVIGCARSCSLTTSVVTAGISTIGSGKFSEFKALSINWSASVDGLCTIDENLDLANLRALQFSLEPVYIYFEETTANDIISYYGAAIITNVQNTGSYNDIDNYSVQLQGTGELQNFSSLVITNVQINTPGAGQTTITFSYASWTGATAYTIRARYLSDDSTHNFTTGASPQSIVITSSLIADGVAFSYRPEYSGSSGNWSPEIYYYP